MEQLRIGIPRALLYYHYHTLWLEFFKKLGMEVIVSPKTNKEILEKGNSYVVDETCLSLKIFMGHVDYLKDKVDYILIPRIESLKTNEKMCTNFLCLYDLVNNTFDNLKILNYNVDIERGLSEEEAFLELGKELNIGYLQTLNAYTEALHKQKLEYNKRIENINNLLSLEGLKILVAAHNYNLEDEQIGKPIINYLKKMKIIPILSNFYDDDAKCECSNISKTIYWTYNKKIMSAIDKLKDKVDGIILLSTFPCGPDSLCNELIIRRVKNVPILYITMDDASSDAGLITRLESFIDILELKRGKNNEKTSN